MTIVPVPVQKPLRRLELVFGLFCAVAGAWMLAQFAFWLFGFAHHVNIVSTKDAAVLLLQSLYLLGFGGCLLLRGYVGLVFWVIALAILIALPATAGWFS